MSRFAFRFLALAVALITAAFSSHAAETVSTIKAGFAERDITPGIGSERPSGYAKQFLTRFHDPCKVRAAVFDDGKRKLAIVSVDALFVPRSVVMNARAEIEKLTGIPIAATMIAATHSHSSGPIGMVQPGQYDAAPEEIRRLAYEESSLANAGYLVRITHEIAQAVRIADQARAPAQLGFGVGHEDKAAFNRRMRMKNGQTWTMPGLMNPDIVDAAGPIDPQVGVIGAWSLDGKLIGTIVNFSCHATTSPGGISANWIYYTERAIQGSLDSRAPVLFLAGACGDVGHVDSRSPYEYRSGEAWAQFIGGRVGAEAVKVLVSIPRGTDVPLDVRQKTWTIPRRAPTAERIANARAILARGKRPPDLTDWLFAKETLMLTHLLATEPAVDVEVQALQIGPTICIGNPAEYFVEWGLEIKKRSRFPFTFVVELANGCVGYVPTDEAFSTTGGGYETRLTSYSNLDITAGRQIAEASVALAHELTPGPLPEFPKIKSPGAPWPYGSVPPEVK
jgi:neutral ceramidase